jgi:hypothetical protein
MNLAALPDPSQPSFVLIAGAFGAFLGATIGRIGRRDRERIRRIAENWAYLFTAIALVVYLIGQA